MGLALKICLLLVPLMGLNISVNASHKKLATFVSDEEQNMMGKRQAEVIVDGILGRGIKPAPVIFHNNLS